MTEAAGNYDIKQFTDSTPSPKRFNFFNGWTLPLPGVHRPTQGVEYLPILIAPALLQAPLTAF